MKGEAYHVTKEKEKGKIKKRCPNSFGPRVNGWIGPRFDRLFNRRQWNSHLLGKLTDRERQIFIQAPLLIGLNILTVLVIEIFLFLCLLSLLRNGWIYLIWIWFDS